MPVSGPSGNSGLSLDHLFVDQTGMPVLVEAKRAENTQSRREVVAQMLDYAANGSVEWTAEQLRTLAEQTATESVGTQFAVASGGEAQEVAFLDSAALLHERLGVDEDPDTFWQTVVGNLRRGRMRLIFLADRIWPELIRIIEFLNAHMPDTDVLGIELPQYTGTGGTAVYVPRVVGRTAAAVAAKSNASSAPGTRWTEDLLLTATEEQRSEPEVALIRRLIKHVRDHQGHFYWGEGTSPAFTGFYPVAGADTPLWIARVGNGRFQFLLREYNARHPYATEAYAAAVAAIPSAIDEVARVRNAAWQGWAVIPLADAASMQDLIFAAIETALSAGKPPGHGHALPVVVSGP